MLQLFWWDVSTIYLGYVDMPLFLVMEYPLILWRNNYLIALIFWLNKLFGTHPGRLYDKCPIFVLIDLLLVPR